MANADAAKQSPRKAAKSLGMVLLIALSSPCTVCTKILAQNSIKCKKREIDGSIFKSVIGGYTLDQTECTENTWALPQIYSRSD
jgi:hypothetical protein